MTQHPSGSASGHTLKFSLTVFKYVQMLSWFYSLLCQSCEDICSETFGFAMSCMKYVLSGFWRRSTHSPECDLSLHCAAAAKRRDSTAFTISNIHWRRKRLLVRWLFISGTGSHQKKMLIVSCLTSYDWSYDVGTLLLPVFNDGLFPSCFILIGCMGKKKTKR